MARAPGFFFKNILAAASVFLCWGGSLLAGEELRARALEVLAPLGPQQASSKEPFLEEKAALGRLLFFEPRVSADGTVSCSRCHLPQLYGTDGLPRSVGVMGRLNPRNAPTVLNAFIQISQHWRGDRESVEDQAVKALIGPPKLRQPNAGGCHIETQSHSRIPRAFQKGVSSRSGSRECQELGAGHWGL